MTPVDPAEQWVAAGEVVPGKQLRQALPTLDQLQDSHREERERQNAGAHTRRDPRLARPGTDSEGQEAEEQGHRRQMHQECRDVHPADAHVEHGRGGHPGSPEPQAAEDEQHDHRDGLRHQHLGAAARVGQQDPHGALALLAGDVPRPHRDGQAGHDEGAVAAVDRVVGQRRRVRVRTDPDQGLERRTQVGVDAQVDVLVDHHSEVEQRGQADDTDRDTAPTVPDALREDRREHQRAPPEVTESLPPFRPTTTSSW